MFDIIYVNNFVIIVPGGYNRSIIIKLLVILFLNFYVNIISGGLIILKQSHQHLLLNKTLNLYYY